MPQVSLVFHTYDVVASPTDDAEVVIAILTNVDTIWPSAPVNLHGWANVEIDPDAVQLTLRIRRGSLTGDIVSNASADLVFVAGATPTACLDLDTQDLPGDLAAGTYVLTATLGSATGPTTVNFAHLSAQV